MREASLHDSTTGLQTAPVSMPAEAIARAQPWDSYVALYVYHRDGVEMVHLRAGVPVVIGRAPPAHVRINASCLSREHARFVLSEGKVIVEDLGSTNGTWVGRQRITRHEASPGDEVVLGRVVVAIVAVTPADSALPGPSSYEKFRGAVEDELARARYFQRDLAVLVVRSPSQDRTHVNRRHAQLRALLRPVDRMALYCPDTVAILLPEASPEAAGKLATKVTEPRSAGEPPLLVGLATFPGAATSAEELLERCLKAARCATPEHPVQPVPLGTWTPGDPPRPHRGSDPPVSASPAMREIFTAVARVARAAIPVLVQGETGTGKEVVARAIHEQSPRRAKPMVSVNCGAIPVHLVESTLFGHERGAFTGAVQQQKGVFEAADGGSVFLDEIGELHAAAQAALLRVLETGRVVRVGSSKEVPVDVRLIAATHRDLDAMCAACTFRLDLLYRLNAITLTIPPLRQRPEDIAPLAERFLEQASQSNDRPIRAIAPEALELLASYAWPGNVRELRNAIERAVVIAEGDTITAADLPERIRAAASVCLPRAEPPGGKNEVDEEDDDEEETGVSDLPEDADTLKARVLRYEAEQIVRALREANGKQTEAAQKLGLPLRTLVHKVKALGIKKLGYAVSDVPPPGPVKSRSG